jgi:hypothetical protein
VAGPDLAAATARVESLMDDVCEVRWDPEATGDDVLDRVTGLYSQPVNDAPIIYDGACYFRPLAQGSDRVGVEGGAAQSLTRYRVALPTSAPVIEPGALIKITASRRDPDAVGMVIRVTERLHKTFAVNRVVIGEQREFVSDRP